MIQRNKHLLIIIALLLNIALLSSYKGLRVSNDFYNDKVVGVIINVDSICVKLEETNKYYNIKDENPKIFNYWLKYLKEYEKEIALKEQIIKKLTKFFDKHNKKYVLLNETVNYTNFPMFKGRIKQTAGVKKRACEYDMRSLKTKYNIEEVMVINIEYGINEHQYNSYIGITDMYNTMASAIIDLNDNSLEMVKLKTSKINIGNYYKIEDKKPEFLEQMNETIVSTLDDLKEQLTPIH